jgi:hypothetical protein
MALVPGNAATPGLGSFWADASSGVVIVNADPPPAGPPTDAHGNIYTTMRAVVPLLTVASQILTVQLNQQSCNLNVYQRTTGLFIDVGIGGQLIICGVIAHDRCKILRDTYLGFVGDLAFWDSQGTQDPDWTGLNQRYYLGYFYPT